MGPPPRGATSVSGMRIPLQLVLTPLFSAKSLLAGLPLSLCLYYPRQHFALSWTSPDASPCIGLSQHRIQPGLIRSPREDEEEAAQAQLWGAAETFATSAPKRPSKRPHRMPYPRGETFHPINICCSLYVPHSFFFFFFRFLFLFLFSFFFFLFSFPAVIFSSPEKMQQSELERLSLAGLHF